MLLPGLLGRIAVFLALIFGYLLSWLSDARLRPDPLGHRRRRDQGRSTTTGSAGPASRPPTGSASRSGTLADGVSVVHGPSFSLTFILLVLPGVIALIAENTGHVKAVAEMTGDDLDPYMGRAIAADGFATALASAFGGSPTTTYAENIGVMGATRVYSTAAYYVAAVVAILLGLCPKFGAIVSATPGGVLGGITVVLYGMIGLRRRQDLGRERRRLRQPGQPGRPSAAGIIAGIGGVTLEDHRRLLARRHRARHDPGHRRASTWSTAVAPPEPAGAPTMPSRRPGDDAEDRRRAAGRRATERREAGTVRLRPAAEPRARRSRPSRREPGAKVLAGGQSLVPLLSMRLAAPAHARRHQRAARTSTTSRVDDDGRPGRRAGPARRRARRRPTYAGSSRCSRRRWRHVAHPTIRNRGTTVGSHRARRRRGRDAGGAARCSDGSVDVASARGHAATIAGRRPLRRPAGVARSRHDEIAVAAFFPALAAGAGVALRGDRPPARRLRAVRGRRRRRAATATASPARGWATCRSATCPVVVDLTDAGATGGRRRRARPRRRRDRPRRPTSTPPPTTARQLVRVLTARVARARRTTTRRGAEASTA